MSRQTLSEILQIGGILQQTTEKSIWNILKLNQKSIWNINQVLRVLCLKYYNVHENISNLYLKYENIPSDK